MQCHTAHILLLCQETQLLSGDINSKCKNLTQILWQSKGKLSLVPYCTDLFEKILSLTFPIEFKAGTGTNSFHCQCKLIIQEAGKTCQEIGLGGLS
jgi:hypothetical protein